MAKQFTVPCHNTRQAVAFAAWLFDNEPGLRVRHRGDTVRIQGSDKVIRRLAGVAVNQDFAHDGEVAQALYDYFGAR